MSTNLNRMNALVREFYRSGKEEPSFYAAVFLSQSKENWEEVKNKSQELPRGWFELCRLPAEDRIAFTRDFWLDQLPFHPTVHFYLAQFFEKLDDLDVVLYKLNESAPWSVEMVYSLKENRTFFRGLPPAKEADFEELKGSFGANIPRDYLSFLRIHNGFGKLSELGLLRIDQAIDERRALMDQLLRAEHPLRFGNRVVDPGALIPFYESFGLASYQCFFADWYPGSEMGNVYLSGIDYTISDCTDRKAWSDQLAFPTFLEWLAFYLEGNSLEIDR